MRTLHRIASLTAGVAGLLIASIGAPALAGESNLAQGQVSLSLGVFEPRGDSDLWDLNETFTTEDTTDYDDALFGAAYGMPLGPNADLQFEISYYQAQADVHYRNFFNVNGDAIRQEHRLTELPMEISLRFLPIARETPGGRLRPVIPYLGGGGGALFWEYREEGRFVDDLQFPTYQYYDERETRRVTGTLHAVAGVEIQFVREFSIFIEGRYRWAKDDLSSDFDSNLDEFDLSGASVSVGATWRFGQHDTHPHEHPRAHDDHDDDDDD